MITTWDNLPLDITENILCFLNKKEITFVKQLSYQSKIKVDAYLTRPSYVLDIINTYPAVKVKRFLEFYRDTPAFSRLKSMSIDNMSTNELLCFVFARQAYLKKISSTQVEAAMREINKPLSLGIKENLNLMCLLLSLSYKNNFKKRKKIERNLHLKLSLRNSIHHINLCGISLQSVTFNKVNFSGINLNKANLTRSNLSNGNLVETDLSGATLFETNLTKSDLTKANLSCADLRGANFDCANLKGANLSHANLFRAKLNTADLTNANFTQCTVIDLFHDTHSLTEALDAFYSNTKHQLYFIELQKIAAQNIIDKLKILCLEKQEKIMLIDRALKHPVFTYHPNLHIMSFEEIRLFKPPRYPTSAQLILMEFKNGLDCKKRKRFISDQTAQQNNLHPAVELPRLRK